jgi:hypothetical protein
LFSRTDSTATLKAEHAKQVEDLYAQIGRLTTLTGSTVQISIAGQGRALDNIFTERFWRVIKYEEMYLHSYT